MRLGGAEIPGSAGRADWTWLMSEQATRILAMGGSPRKGGNSDLLMKAFARGARSAGAECEMVQLRDYAISSCIGCEKCRKDGVCRGPQDGMQLLYPKVVAAQGLALFSPTHNYNVTAWMKAFIDRLYCFYVFDKQRPGPWSSRLAGQGRKAVICAVCEQPDDEGMGFTREAMRLPLEAFGYEVVREVAVYGVFAKGGVREHEEALSQAEEAGVGLAGGSRAANDL